MPPSRAAMGLLRTPSHGGRGHHPTPLAASLGALLPALHLGRGFPRFSFQELVLGSQLVLGEERAIPPPAPSGSA